MGDNPHQVLVKGSAFDVREAEDAAGTGAGLGGSRVLQPILCMLLVRCVSSAWSADVGHSSGGPFLSTKAISLPKNGVMLSSPQQKLCSPES